MLFILVLGWPATATAQTLTPDPAPTLHPDAAPVATSAATTKPTPRAVTPAPRVSTPATTTTTTVAPRPVVAPDRATPRRHHAPRHLSAVALAPSMTTLRRRVATLTTPTFAGEPLRPGDPATLQALAGAALLALAAAGTLVTRRAT